jgi:hypothetical protein
MLCHADTGCSQTFVVCHLHRHLASQPLAPYFKCSALQVFFIRDGMKFPDMVHSLKPNPKNHIQVG